MAPSASASPPTSTVQRAPILDSSDSFGDAGAATGGSWAGNSSGVGGSTPAGDGSDGPGTGSAAGVVSKAASGPNASAKDGCSDEASGTGAVGSTTGAVQGAAVATTPPASCASSVSMRLSNTRTLRLAPTALASATMGPTRSHRTAKTPRTTRPSTNFPQPYLGG